jgi:hypothetical protein
MFKYYHRMPSNVLKVWVNLFLNNEVLDDKLFPSIKKGWIHGPSTF